MSQVSKVYAKEFTAKMMAAKAAKKSGEAMVVVAVEGGFSYMSKAEHEYNLAIAKTKKANKDAASAARKTNVVGRASSGAWLKQVVEFLKAKVIDVHSLTITTDAKARIWIGDAKRPNLFWMKNPVRANAVVQALTA